MIFKSKIVWLVLIFIVGFLFRISEEYIRIQKYPVHSWVFDVSADCGVVLTGGPGRVRTGFDLLTQKKIKKLIISGVFEGVTLRDLMPMWPVYGNLKESDIVLEKRSGTTFGNAQQSLPLVEALGCRDILLITSHIHMHRSYQTFLSSFPETIRIQPYAVVGGSYRADWTELLLESLKSVFYSIWAY